MTATFSRRSSRLTYKRERVFERIALFCFGIAILAEIAGYPYSRRNDEFAALEIALVNKQAADATHLAEAERLARVKFGARNTAAISVREAAAGDCGRSKESCWS